MHKSSTFVLNPNHLQEFRIEHASKVLYHMDLGIKQITDECGFNDRYYFTGVFSEIMDIPPAGCRGKLILNRT